MEHSTLDSEVIRMLDQYTDRYDSWFDRHPDVFQSELKALKKVLPGVLGVNRQFFRITSC